MAAWRSRRRRQPKCLLEPAASRNCSSASAGAAGAAQALEQVAAQALVQVRRNWSSASAGAAGAAQALEQVAAQALVQVRRNWSSASAGAAGAAQALEQDERSALQMFFSLGPSVLNQRLKQRCSEMATLSTNLKKSREIKNKKRLALPPQRQALPDPFKRGFRCFIFFKKHVTSLCVVAV